MFFKEQAQIFFATINFQSIFPHFHFMIFMQERINMYVDPCL